MNRFLWTALAALPLSAPAAQAQVCTTYCCPPTKVNGTFTLNFNCTNGAVRTQLGPWYQYWPYEAHFNLPAPMGQGGGASFMTLPPQMQNGQMQQMLAQQQQQQMAAQYQMMMAGQSQVMMGQPQPVMTSPQAMGQPQQTAPVAQQPATMAPSPVQQSGFQPVGYNYASPVPAYWYGR